MQQKTNNEYVKDTEYTMDYKKTIDEEARKEKKWCTGLCSCRTETTLGNVHMDNADKYTKALRLR